MKKRQKDFLIFFGIFILAILMYINWITMHYASDTYNIINVGYENYATNWSLKDGRLVMYLITMLCAKLNLPIEVYVIGTLVIALLISCATVIKLKNIILANTKVSTKKGIIITIAVFFTIFNFMYIEDMYFVESIVMALSLFLFTYSADYIINSKSIINRIKAMVLAILGVIAYQGTAGFLIILTFVLSLLKNRIELKENIKQNIKTIVLDLIIASAITLVAVVINVLIVKIIGNITGQVQTRVGQISSIFINLKFILNNFSKILKENIGLFPANLLYIFVSVMLIIALICDIKTKSKNFLTIKSFCIIVLSIICAFLVSLGTLSSFYTGRLHYCVGCIIGFVIICLIMENNDEIFDKLFCFILIIYSIISICNCIIVTYQHKLVNEYEEQEVNNIEEYIEEYENTSNIKVENIAIYTVQGYDDKTYFEDISRKSVVTYNAIRCNWASDGVIKFYTNRDFKTINITKDILKEYLSQKNDTGYGIVGNTLIVECYMY